MCYALRQTRYRAAASENSKLTHAIQASLGGVVAGVLRHCATTATIRRLFEQVKEGKHM